MKKLILLASAVIMAMAAHAADRAVFVNRAAAIDTHIITGIDSITFGYNEPVSSSSPRMMYLHAAAAVETVTVDDIDSLTYGTVPAAQTGAYIDAHGWYMVDAEDLAGTYDPYTDPEVITVTRKGYDAGGNAVTFQEEIIKMSRMREPYPNGTTLTARKVALADWIYAGDVVDGMQNLSTRHYPLPNGRWLTPEWEIVENDSLTLRFFAAHAYGRNGTPLAAIEFEVTDGSTTTPRVLVATMSTYFSPVSGLYVPCYEGTVDISSLNNGEITANAILYPHVADAPFDVSVDGDPWPTANYVTVQKHLKATGGGLRYAYVDGAGSGGSEATATDLTTAKSTAYAEPMAAIADLETDQGGSLSACILVLAAAMDHKFTRYDTRTVGRVPFYITGEGADETRAVYTLSDGNAGGLDMSADRLVLNNLIIRQYTASSRMFSNRADEEPVVDGVSGPLYHRLVIKNTFVDKNGLAENKPWIDAGIVNLYQVATNYHNGTHNQYSTQSCIHANLVGCRNIGNPTVYWSIGTDNHWDSTTTDGAGFKVTTSYTKDNGVTYEPHKGPLYAYNWIETSENLNCLVSDGCAHDVEGAHYVGNVMVSIQFVGKNNVFEFYGAAPITSNSRRQLENVVVQHNTGAGGWYGPRDNKMGGVDPIFYWQFFWRGNVAKGTSLPSDYRVKVAYTKDGTQIRNWPQRFGTGWGWTVSYANARSSFGYDTDNGELLPLGSLVCTAAQGLFPGYVQDGSYTGTNDHANGDYRILDDSAGDNKIANIPRMPARTICYPYDLVGTVYPLLDEDDADFNTTAALPGGVQ